MKACKCGCGYPVFSNGYSKGCQRKRTDEKYIKKQKDSREKRFTPQKKMEATKTPIEQSFGYTNQTEMFLDLWHDRYVSGKGIICEFTGEKLDHYKNTQFYWNCFAHVLNKKNYTYFKLNPKNIRVVLPEFHRIIDQGTALEKANHPNWKFDKWNNEVEEMKITYQEFKKSNLLA